MLQNRYVIHRLFSEKISSNICFWLICLSLSPMGKWLSKSPRRTREECKQMNEWIHKYLFRKANYSSARSHSSVVIALRWWTDGSNYFGFDCRSRQNEGPFFFQDDTCAHSLLPVPFFFLSIFFISGTYLEHCNCSINLALHTIRHKQRN